MNQMRSCLLLCMLLLLSCNSEDVARPASTGNESYPTTSPEPDPYSDAEKSATVGEKIEIAKNCLSCVSAIDDLPENVQDLQRYVLRLKMELSGKEKMVANLEASEQSLKAQLSQKEQVIAELIAAGNGRATKFLAMYGLESPAQDMETQQ